MPTMHYLKHMLPFNLCQPTHTMTEPYQTYFSWVCSATFSSKHHIHDCAASNSHIYMTSLHNKCVWELEYWSFTLSSSPSSVMSVNWATSFWQQFLLLGLWGCLLLLVFLCFISKLVTRIASYMFHIPSIAINSFVTQTYCKQNNIP